MWDQFCATLILDPLYFFLLKSLKPVSISGRRAPLALRESLESKVEDLNEMKDFRVYEKPRELKLHPPSWNNSDFYEMSRKQQNLKMYKVNI